MTGKIRILITTVLLGLGLGLVLMAVMLVACGPEEPVARSYQTACYHEQGGDKWTCVSGGEIELRTGATLDIQAGATTNLAGNISSGTGAITITDDVYITNTLDVDGAVTLNSTLDVDGNISSGTGAITITDDVLMDGQADVVQLTVQGYTTQTGKSLVVEQSDGTDVFTVDDDGHYYGRIDYIAKTADYTVTVAETGALFSNGGAGEEITFTLPAAAEGLNYCIYVSETYTVNVDAASGDQIHHLTNAAGDRVQNAGTTGDSICIRGIDAMYWVPLGEHGTWSDAD